jgi:arabinofuranan 3-O-arabinosyltransferase
MPTATAESRAPSSPTVPTAGLARSLALARVFRLEQSDPDTFYRAVAQDTIAQIAGYTELAGRTVLDVGGGGGYFTEAFLAAGARSVLVEPDALRAPPTLADPETASPEERHRLAVWPGRLAPGRTVAGDGYRLPFPDAVADVSFSSNVLEHVAEPRRLVDELLRVTRPGGLLYVSFTAWYSPWGGHETAPWHYLGGARAARRYQARNGRPPKNLFGSSLFACHVGPTLKMLRAMGDRAVVVDALPRYYPRWLRWVIEVPVARELLTWNLLVVLRRTDDHGQGGPG